MTVTLTYDPTLARVRVFADGLGAADVATVERSTDQIMWTTVRGGVNAAVPTGGLVLPGTAGNYASTPDNAALDITGDIDLRADASLSDWTPAGTATFVAKSLNTGNQRGYVLNIQPSGQLRLTWSTTGADFPFRDSTIPVPPPASGRLAVRATLDVDNGAAGHTATFFTAPTIDGPWTQLGAPVIQAGVTSIFANTSVLEVGSIFAGTTEVLNGTVHAVEVRNGIAGTLVARPIFWDDAPTGATGFTDSVGRAWTVNGTASIIHRMIELDDYEFVAGKQNHYRVRGVETGPMQFMGAGSTDVAADNASVSPPHPVETPVPGDLKVVFASIRNSGTGTVNTPAGWTVMRAFGNCALLGRRHVAGDTAPLVTFSGGVAGATTIAGMAVLRRAELVPLTGADQLNGSAQNIAYPGLPDPGDGLAFLIGGWKQDDWTSVSMPAGVSVISAPTSVLGDDASQVWGRVLGYDGSIGGDVFPVTGGAAAISRGFAVALRHADYLNEQTSSITPVLDRIWLKSVTRPFLNRPVTVVDWSPEERPSRSAGFAVVGRTLELAVTDVAGGLQFDLDLHVSSREDAQTLDYIRASGDILFLHTPAGCPVPGGHVCVTASSARRIRPRGSSRVFTLSLSQCAAPGPDVVGATNTWAAVLASYPSWSALLAANPTWSDLIQRIAAPSVVVVS